MIKAVIFDMDGLMIETEHLQSKSFEHVLKKHGVKPEFNEDGVVQKVGITAKDNLLMLKKKHGIDEEVEILLANKQKVYKALLEKNIKPKEGLLNLIQSLKKKGFKLAVASSSSLAHIILVLMKLGLNEKFDAVVSGENLQKGKPHPDIFLEAAKQLNVDPQLCLVLEDAESGVVAAHAAKMKVIAVPNKYTNSHNFAKADIVLSSLAKIDIEQFNSL